MSFVREDLLTQTELLLLIIIYKYIIYSCKMTVALKESHVENHNKIYND